MKKIILLLMMVVTTTISHSQNEYLDYKYSIATNVNFKHTFRSNGITQNRSGIDGISASFFIMDVRKNQHEVSLERISFSNTPMSYLYTRSLDISIGYRYHVNFIKKKNARWIPSLGFGSNLFYSGYRYNTPFSPYPSKGTSIGLQHFITPALTFHASKRIYLNLSFPVNFISTQANFSRMTNQEGETFKNSIFELDSGFNSVNIRFGIGFKF